MSAVQTINRILTLDLLRGYFLLVIILNHLHFYPSGLEWITGQSFLYTSTAEGFFLISGITLGIVRGVKLLEKPFMYAAKLLFKRSFQLYLTSIILVILFTLLGWVFFSDPGIKYGLFQPIGDIWGLIWQAVTLQYTYGWADYLRLYALFIFFSPLALWLLRRGLWYVVLLASTLVWALYPISPLPVGELAMPLSWQFVFFVGFIIGFHYRTVQAWWKRQSLVAKRLLFSSLLTVSIVTLVANIYIVFGHDIPGIGPVLELHDKLFSPYFNKDQLPLPRLLLFAVWFSTLYLLFLRFETPIRRFAGWLLLPFGSNSLYVYTIQAFVVFAALLVFDIPSKEWYINLAISIGVVGLVYLAVRTKFLMRIIPR